MFEEKVLASLQANADATAPCPTALDFFFSFFK